MGERVEGVAALQHETFFMCPEPCLDIDQVKESVPTHYDRQGSPPAYPRVYHVLPRSRAAGARLFSSVEVPGRIRRRPAQSGRVAAAGRARLSACLRTVRDVCGRPDDPRAVSGGSDE